MDVEYEDQPEAGGDNMGAAEMPGCVGDFYDDGSDWRGTFSLYDVWGSAINATVQPIDLSDSVRYGMIGSGESATVCGMSWYQKWRYGNDLGRPGRSEKQFRFGDGHIVKSLGGVTLSLDIPMRSGGDILS